MAWVASIRFAVAVLTVALMPACTDDANAPGKPSGSSSGAGSVLPVELTRQGGIAGFDDRLVVDGTGRVQLYQRGKVTSVCTIDSELRDRIRSAVAAVDWSILPAPRTSYDYPDQMFTIVRTAAGAAHTSDPRVSAVAAPMTRLLDDVTTGAHRLCRI